MDFSAFHAAHFSASQRAVFQQLMNPQQQGNANHSTGVEYTATTDAIQHDEEQPNNNDFVNTLTEDDGNESELVYEDDDDDIVDSDSINRTRKGRFVLSSAAIAMFAQSAAYREELRQEKEREAAEQVRIENQSDDDDDASGERRKRMRSCLEPNPLDDMPRVNTMSVYKQLYGTTGALEIIRRETALNAAYRAQCQPSSQGSKSGSTVVVWPVLPLHC
ncbi:hypothetical protein BDF19DRAFT_439358 [Syncephalis fuscata]|nr:hypothetical protein BDF19DRAFT_439358 [Syncephalis fuscata]